ncbi:hypothetical protein AAC387_Pa04g0413 [Persea americana]
MVESGWRWPSNTVRAAADIKEIVESTKITCLRLRFEDVNGFNKLVGSGKVLALKSFNIGLGRNNPFWNLGYSKNVVVESTGVAGGSHASYLLLPRNVQEMIIRRVHDVTSLSQFCQPPNEEWANLESDEEFVFTRATEESSKSGEVRNPGLCIDGRCSSR